MTTTPATPPGTWVPGDPLHPLSCYPLPIVEVRDHHHTPAVCDDTCVDAASWPDPGWRWDLDRTHAAGLVAS